MEVLKKARSAEILRKLLFETLFSATCKSSFLPPFFKISPFFYLPAPTSHLTAPNLHRVLVINGLSKKYQNAMSFHS